MFRRESIVETLQKLGLSGNPISKLEAKTKLEIKNQMPGRDTAIKELKEGNQCVKE